MTTDDILAPVGDAGGYFANAAVGRMSHPVLTAVTDFLTREATVGGPAAMAEVSEQLAAGYADAARLIGAEADEIAMTVGGNQGLAALIASAGLGAGDRVLVDRGCWGGTLAMLESLSGVAVDVMPVDGDGRVDVAAARARADARTKLVILTWAPATNGLVQPAADVGALAAELGAWYLLDACQLLGQRSVDVRALRCHALVTSGRKWLRGPRGTALLYASRTFLAETRPYLADQFARPRADARRYEHGEAFYAGRLGLGVAIRSVLAAGQDAIADRLADRAAALRARLAIVPGVTPTDRGPDRSALVTFTVAGRSATEVAAALARTGITVSAIGRTYAPLDMDALGLAEVVRAAPQTFTTDADLDRLAAAVAELGR